MHRLKRCTSSCRTRGVLRVELSPKCVLGGGGPRGQGVCVCVFWGGGGVRAYMRVLTRKLRSEHCVGACGVRPTRPRVVLRGTVELQVPGSS
jgi:hypothetical protein